MTDDLRVVLVAPRNPLNIGAAARAMSNFGFTQMRLVKPYDLAFREAKSAVKSHYILDQAQVFDSLAEAVADCRVVAGSTSVGNRDLHVPLYGLEAAAPLLKENLASAALLFGSEKFGLSNDDLSHCHWLFRIPTRLEHGSMNLGQAVAITLYELRRADSSVQQPFASPARAEGADFERITTMLHRLLLDAGFIHPQMADQSALRLRQLVKRLGLPESDAKTWQGIFRQIQWKLDQKKDV